MIRLGQTVGVRNDYMEGSEDTKIEGTVLVPQPSKQGTPPAKRAKADSGTEDAQPTKGGKGEGD